MRKASSRTDDRHRPEDEEDVLPQIKHWVRDMSNPISDEPSEYTSPAVEGTPDKDAEWYFVLRVPNGRQNSQARGNHGLYEAEEETAPAS